MRNGNKMAYILYDHGEKIGEIIDWTVSTNEPTFKNILGKVVLSAPAKNECAFISPKPVNRKSQLVVLQDGKHEFTLQVKRIKDGTFVSALIASEKDLSK